jgi:hypothetical protein
LLTKPPLPGRSVLGRRLVELELKAKGK